MGDLFECLVLMQVGILGADKKIKSFGVAFLGWVVSDFLGEVTGMLSENEIKVGLNVNKKCFNVCAEELAQSC
jgi:hypothetical protein